MKGDAVGFIQIIEITTRRMDEIEVLMNEWLSTTEGRRQAQRGTLTADRDRPDTYVQIVEFPSYEEAMANSNLPETQRFAEQMVKLCDKPPTFRNLDVTRTDDFS
jgi:hypothetical protein